MTNKQMPGALRLADECDASAIEFLNETNTRRAAAATIRRQHAEIERLRAEVEGLRNAVCDYLEAQDALDNREYHGINAEPYDKLIRRRNNQRDDLDAALPPTKEQP